MLELVDVERVEVPSTMPPVLMFLVFPLIDVDIVVAVDATVTVYVPVLHLLAVATVFDFVEEEDVDAVAVDDGGLVVEEEDASKVGQVEDEEEDEEDDDDDELELDLGGALLELQPISSV